MFGQDTYNADQNEPSSDKDEKNKDEENEELFQGTLHW